MVEGRLGDEEDQCGRINAPRLVEVAKKAEERFPGRRVAPGVNQSPWLIVERGRRPARGLEQDHQVLLGNGLSGQGAG